MIDELIRVRGIGPTAAERLINAGVKSIEEISDSKPEELAWIKGIGMISAKNIIENAMDLFIAVPLLTLLDYHISKKYSTIIQPNNI